MQTTGNILHKYEEGLPPYINKQQRCIFINVFYEQTTALSECDSDTDF